MMSWQKEKKKSRSPSQTNPERRHKQDMPPTFLIEIDELSSAEAKRTLQRHT